MSGTRGFLRPREIRERVNQEIRKYAEEHGVDVQSARHRIVFHELLLVMFRDEPGGWVLKGSTALVLRTGGGRFTKDVDLATATQWSSADDVAAAVRRQLIQAVSATDPLRFEVRGARTKTEADPDGYRAGTVKLSMRSFAGPTEFSNFTIDVSVQRNTQQPLTTVEIAPTTVFGEGRDAATAMVPLVAVESQVADKVCAMYERHGEAQSASSRFHDLADLVRIVQHEALDAKLLDRAIGSECGRRRLRRPQAMVSPAGNWDEQFGVQSREYADYPEHLCELTAALAEVGQCLDEVLSEQRSTGRWDPEAKVWTGS